jgi:putative ABC transport system substrate-binding protein
VIVSALLLSYRRSPRSRTIALLAPVTLAVLILLPLLASAQRQPGVPRIGYLQAYPSLKDPYFPVFRKQLQELGHVEGKTVAFEYRSAEGQYDRLPALAAALVQLNVDVIVADGGTPPTMAARSATQTIPIVFSSVADPVGQGLVASLTRPGGNVTGISSQQIAWAPKLLELFKEVFPSAKLVAVLSNPGNSSLPAVLREMMTAAKSLNLDVRVFNARTPGDLEPVFAEIGRERPAGVVVVADVMFNGAAGSISRLAARYRLPTLAGHNAIPETGGFMSYGPNRLEPLRRTAVLADKILKGAKPSELPVELPLKFDLIVNRKTAKALGLTIPPSVLVRAERVID